LLQLLELCTRGAIELRKLQHSALGAAWPFVEPAARTPS
jgi:hypothetical protein